MSEPNFPSPEELQKKLYGFHEDPIRESRFGFHPGQPHSGGGKRGAAWRPSFPRRGALRVPASPARHQSPSRSLRHPAGRRKAGPRDRRLRPLQQRQLHAEARGRRTRRRRGRPSTPSKTSSSSARRASEKPISSSISRNLSASPSSKADATKFSETGYVGGDVEDLVRELVQRMPMAISSSPNMASFISMRSTRSPPHPAPWGAMSAAEASRPPS